MVMCSLYKSRKTGGQTASLQTHVMRESEIKAMNTKENKEMNKQELNLNETEQVTGGLTLLELWLRNNYRNDDD